MSRTWAAYYERAGLGPPRATLRRALAGLGAGEGRSAVDLGCGIGRDTLEMLRQGFAVTAVDSEAVAIRRLEAEAKRLGLDARLDAVHARMEDAAWPMVDLVNSSFALPLCPPERFSGLWQRIRASLLPGGWIACQLYGRRDGWSGRPGITCHDREEILALLDGLAIEHLEESESEGVTRSGAAKHWHVFDIDARRPGS